jgi:hypothetical protein
VDHAESGASQREKENAESRKVLSDVGIEVLDSNSAFDITHKKSMVVDEKSAFIRSLNCETRNLTETRDNAGLRGRHIA